MIKVTIEDPDESETTVLEFDEMSISWQRGTVPSRNADGEVTHKADSHTYYTIEGAIIRRTITPFPDGPLTRLRMAFAGRGYDADEMRVAMDQFLESQVPMERAG